VGADVMFEMNVGGRVRVVSRLGLTLTMEAKGLIPWRDKVWEIEGPTSHQENVEMKI
jgi:hypothetical protein